MADRITYVPGIRVGHYTDPEGVTGCTVVLCEAGAVAGVDVRGSAPGTRETELLRPMNLVDRVHGVLLSGGSAFGLDAASGVMRYLEERGRGLDVGVGVVPIVPAAILFDLGLGDPKARPGPSDAYDACVEASEAVPQEGSVGVGTGATVGKALGQQRAVKGGVGSAAGTIAGEVVVGALAAVNAWGSVFDPASGEMLAGPLRDDGAGFLDSTELLVAGHALAPAFAQSTTLGIVATDASLTKEQANKVAQMAQDGIAMAVRPAHTMFDGDIVFALSTGQGEPFKDTTAIGAVAAWALGQAIVRVVTLARGMAGVPSAAEVRGTGR
ncbi:MAG: P1 family peptidase [Dehalococcoidia bacterium]